MLLELTFFSSSCIQLGPDPVASCLCVCLGVFYQQRWGHSGISMALQSMAVSPVWPGAVLVQNLLLFRPLARDKNKHAPCGSQILGRVNLILLSFYRASGWLWKENMEWKKLLPICIVNDGYYGRHKEQAAQNDIPLWCAVYEHRALHFLCFILLSNYSLSLSTKHFSPKK